MIVEIKYFVQGGKTSGTGIVNANYIIGMKKINFTIGFWARNLQGHQTVNVTIKMLNNKTKNRTFTSRARIPGASTVPASAM